MIIESVRIDLATRHADLVVHEPERHCLREDRDAPSVATREHALHQTAEEQLLEERCAEDHDDGEHDRAQCGDTCFSGDRCVAREIVERENEHEDRRDDERADAGDERSE